MRPRTPTPARRILPTLLVLLPALAASGFAAPRAGGTVTPEIRHDLSPPLREMTPAAWEPESESDEGPARRPLDGSFPAMQDDPVLQTIVGAQVATTTSLNFRGLGSGFSGPQGSFFVASDPPDTNGAAGLTQYVQWVNFSFAVFDKATGATLYGPVTGSTLWQGFGGPCEAYNNGDPIVRYDQLADRWVMTQFAVTGGPPYYQCMAVSTTSDATGSWHRYSFAYSDKNDYPKLGVWPDAYYLSFNRLFFESFLGGEACAFDRAAMLVGAPATQQCFQVSPPLGNFLPADLDGRSLPPAGSPNWFIAFGTDELQIWSFHVDWATPASSTFTGPVSIAVAPFTPACGGAVCIPQSGTSQQIDSLGDRLMDRFAYRNLGAHESAVVNHAIVAGTTVGVRWYEVRGLSGTPFVEQQGTFSPDAEYRWMGSLAMDAAGNMAMGYSVSSPAIHPAVRTTGRWVTDTPGTMQSEASLFEGPASQTSSAHWGDYSSMSVDPVDDCTFWYTNEYLIGSSLAWSSRIASFRFPPPSEPTGLQITNAAGVTQISWVRGAGSVSSDLLRGSLRSLPVGPGGADEVCLADNLAASSFSDGSTPAVGQGYFYVIRSKSPCGRGSYGFRTQGGTPTVERTSSTCP